MFSYRETVVGKVPDVSGMAILPVPVGSLTPAGPSLATYMCGEPSPIAQVNSLDNWVDINIICICQIAKTSLSK